MIKKIRQDGARAGSLSVASFDDERINRAAERERAGSVGFARTPPDPLKHILDQEESESRDSRNKLIREAIFRIEDKRVRTVIIMRLGLDGEPPRDLRACGQAIGCSKESVRHLETQGLRQLALQLGPMLGISEPPLESLSLKDVGSEFRHKTSVANRNKSSTDSAKRGAYLLDRPVWQMNR